MKNYKKIFCLLLFTIMLNNNLLFSQSTSQGITAPFLQIGKPSPPENLAEVAIKGHVYIYDYANELQEKDVENTKKYLLLVKKVVVAEDLAIAQDALWTTIPDYVFEDDYELTPLSEIETYVKKNHHLPGIVSQTEVKEQGLYEVNDMVLGQLKNLEELALHTIAVEKKLIKQETYINELVNQITNLKQTLVELEQLTKKCK